MSVRLEAVERTLEVLADSSPVPFAYQDPSTGERLTISPAALASSSGFLPAVLSAGEAVWQEVTGNGFALDLAHDPEALLGFRLRGIGAGSFTTVMLSAMEAMHQVAGPDAVLVSDLGAVWAAVSERMRYAEPGEPSVTSGARP